MNKWIHFSLLTILLTGTALGVRPAPPDAKTITVGISELKPIGFFDSDGEARGLAPDLLREIFRNDPNVQLEFVPVDWAKGVEMAKQGELDLMACVPNSGEKQWETMSFNYSPIVELWGEVYVAHDQFIREIQELSGKKIGISDLGNRGKQFIELAETFSVDCEIVAYPSYDAIFAAIDAGEIDAGVAPHHFGIENTMKYGVVGTPIRFTPFPAFFATQKGRHTALLKTIDARLIDWKGDEKSNYYDRLDYWMRGAYHWKEGAPKWLWLSIGGVLVGALFLLWLIRALYRKILEQYRELRDSESQFKALFEHMITGAVIYNPIDDGEDFVIADMNKAGLKNSLLTDKNLVAGQRVTEAFPGVKETGLLDVFQRVWRTGKPKELPLVHYTDARMDQWVKNYVFKLPSGRIVANYEDVTAHKLADDKLRESEERFRSSINDLQVGVVLHNPDTSIILCNPAAACMLGVDIEEAVGKVNSDPAWNFVHEDLSSMPIEDFPVNQVLATGTMIPNQIFGIMRPDREEPLWCNSTAVPIFGKDNQIERIIVNFADISELKQTERNLNELNKELAEGKQTLQATLDGLSSHIALLDDEGTILLVNRRWRDFAIQNGMPANANAEGTNYLSACENVSGEEADQVSEFTKGILDVLAGKKLSFSIEYPCHSDDEQRWFLATINLFPGDGPHRVVVAHENITQRKIAEEALIGRNQELERFNKMMTGRELRMIELKKEINALCRELGRPELYNNGADGIQKT